MRSWSAEGMAVALPLISRPLDLDLAKAFLLLMIDVYL